MKVLIIYEIIPDETLVYVVDNPCEALLTLLHAANDSYINAGEGEGVDASNVINMEACLEDKYLPNGYERQFPGKFQQIKISELPNAGPFDKVFHTGFYL